MSSALNFMVKLLSATALSWTLVGCASEAEKEARRENAFDLAGTYTATAQSGSSFDFTMNISNENGRYDVFATMDRALAITNQESTFLQNKHGLNPGTVSSYFTKTLSLGRGSGNSLDGGENISDDFGESSRVSICTASFKYNAQKSLRYCMNGTIRKSDFVLRGQLTLYVSTETQKVDQNGKPYTEVEVDSTSLPFIAKGNDVYLNQYFGTWAGAVTVNDDAGTDTTRVSSMVIQRASDTTFSVSAPVGSITVQGQAYAFESRSFATTQLADKTIPLVEMSFRRNDTDRVIFVGEIRSLGNLSGSVIWINGPNRVLLGSFLFKKR